MKSPARRCSCRRLPRLVALALLVPTAAFGSIGVNKTFNPTNVSAGQTSTLTVILINNNATAATGATFADTLPGTVVVASSPNASTTCAGGTVTATPAATSFSVAGATIPAAVGPNPGQCTVQVDVVSASAGVFINTIPVGGVSSSQGSNPQAAQATLTVAALISITGTKTFAPTNVHGNGNPSTVTITLTNPNGVALTNTAFTDTLPAQLAIAPTPNASTTCAGGAVTTGASSASLGGGTIPANGSCVVHFDVIAAAPNTAFNTNATNSIAANAVTTTQGVRNSAFSATIRVQKSASITKAFSPSPIASGATSTLSIAVNNFNASTISPIAFTDTLPAGMTIAPTPNASTTCTGGTVTAVPGAGSFNIAGGSLAGVAANAGITNTSCAITVSVTASNAAPGPVTLTNTIAAGNFGGAAYAAASGALIVQGSSSVGALKTFSPATVLQGGTTTLTITLANSSAAPATITAFTDNLSTMGTGFTNTGAATTTCGGAITATAGTTAITLGAGNTIPANGTCTITAPVQVGIPAQTGARTNSIAAGALQTSNGNNQAAITAVLTVNAVLTVAKAFAPNTVLAGTDSRLTVTLTRGSGAPALSGIAFVDTLPASHAVSSTPNLASTCGGTVTASGSTIALTGGAIGGAPCSVAVNVTTPPSAGSATNTIAAGAVSTAEGYVNATAATATLTRVITNVTLNKSFSPATVAVGGTSTLTINVLNNNANAVGLATAGFTDTLPVGMTVAPAPAASNTCGGTFTPVAGAGSVTLANASISANATCRVQVNVVASIAGNLINTLPSSTFTSSQHVTNPLPASATLTATGNADLAITKTDGVAAATPGGTTTYTIVARNNGPSGVAGASVIDTPPPGMTFGAWTCTASSGSSCTASGSGAINDLVTLQNGGTATYTVSAQIATGATGSITNTASVVAPAAVVDSNSANDSASDTDTLVGAVALAVVKTDNSATYTPGGGGATYAITVTNAGPSDATNVTVADALPAGVALAGNATCVASAGSSCGSVSGSAGATSFGASGAYVAAGNSGGLVFTVPVAFAAALATDPLVNTAGATDVASGGTASGSDSDTRAAIADVSIAKVGPATVNAGAAITYTLTIANAGPSAANGATFVDNVPAAITSVGASCGGASGGALCPASVGVAGNTVSANVPVLPPGGSVVVTITGTAPASGTLANTATVSPPAGTSDPNLANNSASATSSVTTVTDLAITKDDGSATYTPGGSATYTIVVTNAGPSDAANVAVSDPLPAGVTLSADATCVASGTATCGTLVGTAGQSTFGTSGATIAAGAANRLTFTLPVAFASSMSADPLVNTATASDPASPTRTASDSDARSAQVALAVTKTDGSATYTPGGSATYTITVTNAGPSDAANLTIGDSLPAGVLLTASVGCAALGTASCGTVTGAAGETSFSAIGASIAADTGNSIVFTVPVAFAPNLAADPLVNTATATDVASGASASGSDSDARLLEVSLAVAKSDGSTSYTPGGSATYTVIVTNGGTSDALDVQVSDALPAGVTLAADATCVASGVASCGTVSGAAGQTAFGATDAALAAGNGNAITFTAPVLFAASLTIDPLQNTATASDLASGASGSATDSDIRAADVTLAVNKTDGSATYTPGGTATYAIIVANNGASDALNVTVADPLPAGVTLSGSVTCTATGAATCGTVSGTAGETSFGTTGAAIAHGAGNLLAFSAPVAFAANLVADPLINTVTANDLASGASGSATDSDARSSSVTLAVTKTDGSATYTPGASATYVITVVNNGASDALNVTVADPLPAGVTLAVAATCTANGTSSCGAVSGAAGESVVGTTGATVAAGASNALTFTVPVAFAPSMTTDPLINTVGVTDLTSGASGSASDSDTRSSSVALAVTKTDGSATYTPGGTATYLITVANNGASDALNVTVSDPLPAGITLSGNATCAASGAATCGTVSGSAGQTSFGTTGASIAHGAGNLLTFGAPVAFAPSMTADPLINTVSVTDATSGASGSASDSDARAPSVTLAVTKTDGSATYTPGGTAIYTVTVSNNGVSDALNVSVNDPLPSGVTLGASASCTASGSASCGTVFGSLGQTSFGVTGASIARGAGNLLTFTVPVAFASTLTADPLINTVTANDLASGASGSASDSDTRSAAVTLTVTKSDGSATYTPGGGATYTITIANTGASDALNVSVLDTLPPGVTSSANTTCVATGAATCGTVSGSAGQSSVTASGGSIAHGAGNLLTFTVPVAFASTLTADPLINTVAANDLASGASGGASDSDARAARADVSLFKSGVASAISGAEIVYTLTIGNAGPSAADGASVHDNVPAGFAVSGAQCGGAAGGAVCGTVTVNAIEVNATVAALPVGGSVVVTISGHATAAGTIVNTASVVPPPGVIDPNPANDISTTSAVISAPPINAGVPIPALSLPMFVLLALAIVVLAALRHRART